MPRYRFRTQVVGQPLPEADEAWMEFPNDAIAYREAKLALIGLTGEAIEKDAAGVEIAVSLGSSTIYQGRVTIAVTAEKGLSNSR